MKKNKWISALLNFVFFGAGYIYNGQKTSYGVLLTLGWVIIRTGEINIYLTGLVQNYWLILMAGLGVLQFAFAIDGYKEAKTINQE